MERFTRGLTFWILVIASLVPTIAYGQQLKKIHKCLYTANVASNGSGTGSASLVVQQKGYVWPTGLVVTTDLTYRVKSTVNGVQKVHLEFGPDATPTVVPICDPTGDACDYDEFLNLFVAGALTADALPPGFPASLGFTGGPVTLRVEFNDGALGAGTFVLAQPCSSRIFD